MNLTIWSFVNSVLPFFEIVDTRNFRVNFFVITRIGIIAFDLRLVFLEGFEGFFQKILNSIF